MPGRKYVHVYMQIFKFVGVSVIEIRDFNKKMKKNMANCEIPYYKYYTGFTRFCRFFSISLVFNIFTTLMLVRVKLNGI